MNNTERAEIRKRIEILSQRGPNVVTFSDLLHIFADPPPPPMEQEVKDSAFFVGEFSTVENAKKEVIRAIDEMTARGRVKVSLTLRPDASPPNPKLDPNRQWEADIENRRQSASDPRRDAPSEEATKVVGPSAEAMAFAKRLVTVNNPTGVAAPPFYRLVVPRKGMTPSEFQAYLTETLAAALDAFAADEVRKAVEKCAVLAETWQDWIDHTESGGLSLSACIARCIRASAPATDTEASGSSEDVETGDEGGGMR